MMLSLKKAIAGVAIGSVGVLGLATTQAGATGIIANSGQDNLNDILVGGGSDTTYVVENDLGQLYNQSPGCNVVTSAGPTIGQCIVPAGSQTAPTANLNTNWDHDVLTSVYPTGSSGGVATVISGGYDFARSSRAAEGTELSTTTFWGYAKDGIAIVTPAGRAVSNLTTAQLCGIWNGTITNWSTIPGQAAGTIRPYGMNSNSGTYKTFKTYLGASNCGVAVDPNTNGLQVGSGPTAAFPFENDLKPVLADAATKGYVASDIVWWGSFGELKTYGYKLQNASFWQVNGVSIGTGTIANNSYNINRILFRVTPDASITLTGTNAGNTVLSTTGATSGKGGGVRRATEWLCQPSSFFDAAGTNTALNPFDGNTYFKGIGDTITKSGFQRTPSAERTAGACSVST